MAFAPRKARNKSRTRANNLLSRFARPNLEMLEDRMAPAVLTVNTLADMHTPDSVLSLRQAIGVVNSGSLA